jgi:hypothetical protein
MERTNEANGFSRAPTLVVTGMSEARTVDEVLNETFSPLTYRDRAKKYFPAKQEPDTIEHYFVSVILL